MTDTFNASANSIKINNGSQVIFDTSYRMPHILSSVSGSFSSTNAGISTAGGVFINTVTDNIVDTKSYYNFSNSFLWAWIDITRNDVRTDLQINSPLFLTGSLLLRFYINNSSLRGSYIITPMIYSGGVGFREEWQYADNTNTIVPGGLYPTDGTNTNGNMGLTYSYTLYYGRFI
jgi:hypothetical protein